MSDTEPSPLPQELIGVPKDDTAHVEGLLKDIRARYKECLAPILVDREKVDPRVIQFEKQLYDFNERRTKFYGREYNPPEILYVDRVQGTQRSAEINDVINKSGLGKFGRFDENAGTYQAIGNYIIMFVNNFDDKDVDSWDVCRKIRHELSHAGSVRKHRAYRDESGNFSYQGYRMGARLDSKKRGNVSLGLAIDEGHHAIEDEIFEGVLHPELLEQDEYLKALPNGQQLFPGAKQKYEQLRQQAIKQGEIKPDQMLMSYRKNNGMNLIGTANLYEDYCELMRLVYQRNPELFGLARDFIYGDKMTVFAKQVDLTFEKGFF
jgi:hypothetical protein